MARKPRSGVVSGSDATGKLRIALAERLLEFPASLPGARRAPEGAVRFGVENFFLCDFDALRALFVLPAKTLEPLFGAAPRAPPPRGARDFVPPAPCRYPMLRLVHIHDEHR